MLSVNGFGITLALALAAALGLAACSDDATPTKDSGTPDTLAHDQYVPIDSVTDTVTPDAGPDLAADATTLDMLAADLAADAPTSDAVTDAATGDTAAGDTAAADAGPPPANSTCATALAVTLTGAKTTLAGDTTNAPDEFGTTIDCGNSLGPWLGPQVYYKVSLTAGKTYKITMLPTGAGFDGALFAFPAATGCAAAAINTACAPYNSDAIGSTAAEKLLITPTASADWILVADSYDSSEYGPFTLTIEEVVKPQNDACAAAQTITLTAGKVTLTGDSSLAANEFSTDIDCGETGNQDGPQLYYSVALTGGKKYLVTLSPVGFDATLYAYKSGTACTSAAINTACSGSISDTGVTGDDEVVIIAPTVNESWVLVADAYSATESGSFTLTVEEFTPPQNDTCATAKAVTLTAGAATISDTKVGASSALAKCGSDSLPATDLWYKFTPTVGKTYKITFKPQGSGGRFGVWDGNHNCAATAVETACGVLGSTYVSGGSTGSLTITSTAGDVYFVADGLSSSYDVYSFTFEIAQQP